MRKIQSLLFSVAALAVLTLGLGLAQGEPAPAFSAKNQDGKEVRLADLKGKPVLLYFYPKDDTPGCTQEACAFRDGYASYQKMGAVILGVSRQNAKSHQDFRKKHHLQFDLLTDADGKLAESYGVKLMPVVGYHQRQSVLIGADGKLIKVYPDVDPALHSKEVLKDLEAYAIRAGKPPKS